MAVIDFRPRKEKNSIQRDAAFSLSEDIEYRSFAEETDTKDRQKGGKNYTDKIRRHRLYLFLRFFLVVSLTAAIVICVIVQINTRTFSTASFNEVSSLTYVEGTAWYNLNGHILAISKDGASCTDTKGNVLWNVTYEMQEPVVSIAGNVAAIADYSGSNVYVMNTSGQLCSVSTDLPVYAVSAAENGSVAVVLNGTDAMWVNMYDAKGNMIEQSKLSMGQMGYPLSVSISPNGELLCISHLQISGTKVKTSIAFYNFGAVGQNYSDNCVSGYDYEGEIFPVTHFMDGTTAFAVSDSRLVFFQGKQIPQNGMNNLFSENLKGVYYDKSYVALVFNDVTGEDAYRLELYNSSGNKVSEFGFDLDYTSLQISGDCVIMNNEQECRIYSTGGVQRYAGEFGRNVSLLVPSSRTGVMTVVTEDEIDTMVLN